MVNMTLSRLVRERPIIERVLLHPLNEESKEMRDQQSLIHALVAAIQEGHKSGIEVCPHLPIWTVTESVIRASAKWMLFWFGDNWHEYKDPLLRLLRVLDGEENVDPERNLPDSETKFVFNLMINPTAGVKLKIGDTYRLIIIAKTIEESRKIAVEATEKQGWLDPNLTQFEILGPSTCGRTGVVTQSRKLVYELGIHGNAENE